MNMSFVDCLEEHKLLGDAMWRLQRRNNIFCRRVKEHKWLLLAAELYETQVSFFQEYALKGRRAQLTDEDIREVRLRCDMLRRLTYYNAHWLNVHHYVKLDEEAGEAALQGVCVKMYDVLRDVLLPLKEENESERTGLARWNANDHILGDFGELYTEVRRQAGGAGNVPAEPDAAAVREAIAALVECVPRGRPLLRQKMQWWVVKRVLETYLPGYRNISVPDFVERMGAFGFCRPGLRASCTLHSVKAAEYANSGYSSALAKTEPAGWGALENLTAKDMEAVGLAGRLMELLGLPLA